MQEVGDLALHTHRASPFPEPAPQGRFIHDICLRRRLYPQRIVQIRVCPQRGELTFDRRLIAGDGGQERERNEVRSRPVREGR